MGKEYNQLNYFFLVLVAVDTGGLLVAEAWILDALADGLLVAEAWILGALTGGLLVVTGGLLLTAGWLGTGEVCRLLTEGWLDMED